MNEIPYLEKIEYVPQKVTVGETVPAHRIVTVNKNGKPWTLTFNYRWGESHILAHLKKQGVDCSSYDHAA